MHIRNVPDGSLREASRLQSGAAYHSLGLEKKIWGVPPAGGPLLYLPTAQADLGNCPNSYLLNLANDRPPHLCSVLCVVKFGYLIEFG